MIQPIIDDKKIERLRSLLNGVKHVVLTCHLSPDGDALGSVLGLCHVLRRLGKDAQVVTPDMPPRVLWFLPGVKEVTVQSRTEARARLLVERAQLIICLDFNTMRRIDKLADVVAASRAPRVLIDHHLNPDDTFDLVISHPEASSTCELVFRVLLQLRMLNLIDRTAAQCLYTGMMTDTGNFTFSCENPELYEIQASLMRRHIGKQALYEQAMNTSSLDSLRLQGYALNEKLQVFADHHAALITLTLDELQRFNYKRGDTEGLVNKPLAVPEVRWVVFLREESDHIKVSCRSQGDIDVNVLCNNYFNGGGHKNAAGGELHTTIDEAVALFMHILETDSPVVATAEGEQKNEMENTNNTIEKK